MLSLLIPISTATPSFNILESTKWGHLYESGKNTKSNSWTKEDLLEIGTPRSKWNIEFIGVPEDAKAAFKYAVDKNEHVAQL